MRTDLRDTVPIDRDNSVRHRRRPDRQDKTGAETSHASNQSGETFRGNTKSRQRFVLEPARAGSMLDFGMKAALHSWSQAEGWSATGDAAGKCLCPQVVLCFGDRKEISSAREAIKELEAAYPEARIVVCSTAGEIFEGYVTSGGLRAMALQFENSWLSFSSAAILENRESRSAGEKLAAQIPPTDLRGIAVLSDGTRVNGTELVAGLLASLPSGVPLFGGLAGDGDRFGETLVGFGAEASTGQIVAIGFHGEKFEMRCGSAGGWEPFGPQRRITRSSENVLYELDGEPALAVYKRYLGERAKELPAAALLFPLEVYTKGPGKEGVVRTILAIDEAAQTMTFAGDMPQGELARLMHAGPERLMRGACDAANRAGDGSPFDAVVAVSCVGRRLVLRQRAEDEVQEVLGVIGATTPLIGFYSYGELCPPLPGAPSELHNQTMALMLLRERP